MCVYLTTVQLMSQDDVNEHDKKAVCVGELRTLLGTPQGAMMKYTDLFFATSCPVSMRMPDGIAYQPSTMTFQTNRGESFFAQECHKTVQLTGCVLWEPLAKGIADRRQSSRHCTREPA